MTYFIGQAFYAFAQFPLTPNPPQSAKITLLHNVGITVLEFLGLAFSSFALGSLTSSLWIWTGGRNIVAIRRGVYRAVTQKDMVWFFTKMGVKSADGEQGPLGARGLMAKFTRFVTFILSLVYLNLPHIHTEKQMTCAWHFLLPPGQDTHSNTRTYDSYHARSMDGAAEHVWFGRCHGSAEGGILDWSRSCSTGMQIRSLVCFFMLNRVSFTSLQNNMSKDVTILDTTARFTKLKVENRILGILYG
jgi:hypothetical protein